jgi:hypothetical protein
MKHGTGNFIVACVGFILLISLATTGAILRYVVPCGGGRRWRGGRGAAEAGQHIRELWSISRHQWLDIHFWIAAAFLVIIAVHILLNWDWIRGYIKSIKRGA